MPNEHLDSLEHQIDQLVYYCAQLEKENKALRSQETSWGKEKNKLVKKNERAKTQVEGMLDRLQVLASPQPSSSSK